VPGIYLHIQIMNRVYRDPAIGVGAVLGTPRLAPDGHRESVTEPEHGEYSMEYRLVSAGCSLVQ
jgi:hypothetical protein